MIDPSIMDTYFQSINTDPDYSSPEQLPIPGDTLILFVEVHNVRTFLSRQKHTAVGPNELPYWLWRDYSNNLAPVVTDIFSSSLRLQVVPRLWKWANVLPIPKELPLEASNQLRHIS